MASDHAKPLRAASGLRLINARVASGQHRAPAEGSQLDAMDPRWVLAVRTAGSLEGGRAAVLSPERRRRLVMLAQTMGLRPFDAAVVVALVQDAVRRGEEPLSAATANQLGLVRPARHARKADGLIYGLAVVCGVLLAVSVVMSAAGWIAGG